MTLVREKKKSKKELTDMTMVAPDSLTLDLLSSGREHYTHFCLLPHF